MRYLLDYVYCRTTTDAPKFYMNIMKSFLFKTAVLMIFLPFDLIYYIVFIKMESRKFDVIVFSEKYKDICDMLDGTVGLITRPSLNMYFSANHNVVYVPASIYFLLTAISLMQGTIVRYSFFRLDCSVLVLHTDGLMVSRYLLAVFGYCETICIQHGEYSYLNDTYDGKLCRINIVMGDDQAELFRKKKFPGKLAVFHPQTVSKKSTHCSAVVLVGQGYQVNDPLRQLSYQKELKKLHVYLRKNGIVTYYRAHPSESIFDHWRFLFMYEPNCGRQEFVLTHCYVGSESTLLRQVKENGGMAVYTDKFGLDTCLDLASSMPNKGIPKTQGARLPLNSAFVKYAAGVVNEYSR